MEILVHRARTGDQNAFTAIVEQRQRWVVSLATGYLGRSDAEDAAQVIWAAVWNKLWQVEEPARFDSWLRTVVFHQCLNLRKARARRNREIQLSAEAWLALAECTGTGDYTVAEILEHKELHRLLSQELDLLPGDYGLLLRLYYFRDLDYNAISALTGIGASALKWRLHQGRKLLRFNLSLRFKHFERGGIDDGI